MDVLLTPVLASPSSRRLGRSTSWQAAFVLAVVVASVMTASVARAELNLRWDAPPSCPRRGEVLDRIRALAGSSLDNTEGLSAEGRIARTNGRFSLTLLVRDGRHLRKRVITSDSCADLGGAAAITLALLLGVDVGAAASSAQNDARGEAAPQDGEPDEGERNARAGGETRLEQQGERGGKDRDNRSEEPAERGRVSPDGRGDAGSLVDASLGPLDPSPDPGCRPGAATRPFRRRGARCRGSATNRGDFSLPATSTEGRPSSARIRVPPLLPVRISSVSRRISRSAAAGDRSNSRSHLASGWRSST